MRIKLPGIGDVRGCSGFLRFPRLIGGEIRWLEHARWEEVWDTNGDGRGPRWIGRKWLDTPDAAGPKS